MPNLRANVIAIRHALCGDRETRYLCLDILRSIPPLVTVEVKHSLDRLAGIGHGFLSRVSFGHNLGQGWHQDRVTAFGLRMKIDRKLSLSVHDPMLPRKIIAGPSK